MARTGGSICLIFKKENFVLWANSLDRNVIRNLVQKLLLLKVQGCIMCGSV